MTDAIREMFMDDLDGNDDLPWHGHEWTSQQVVFCSEYLRTGNVTRAYRTAFVGDYPADSPACNLQTRARTLLKKHPVLAEYIRYVQKQMAARLAVNKESVLSELAKLGFANMSDFVVLQSDGTPQFDLSGITHEQSAAIQEMTIDTYVEGRGDDGKMVKSVKVKLAPKINALELLGKNLKLFTDVIETNPEAQTLADEIRRAREARKERQDGNDDAQDADDGGSGNDEGAE